MSTQAHRNLLCCVCCHVYVTGDIMCREVWTVKDVSSLRVSVSFLTAAVGCDEYIYIAVLLFDSICRVAR